MERRLAAILSADVVGYSKLMGEDEAGTLGELRRLRRDILAPAMRDHRGNLIKSMGDGWLIEFPSAGDAIKCAIEVQQTLADHRAIKLRIGLHIGDVTFEDEDIYGDGVNIAARLQEIAVPGGILVSGTARRSIDGKLAASLSALGSRHLKNIAEPVDVYGWGIDEAAMGGDETTLALPDKPSIVVLPFDNMSGEADQDYFADGLCEDIITDLSRFEHLFVIARNTAFTYKGKEIDVTKAAAELGVHFVLEGSVRKAGNRVRITAQLIDGLTGNHVWAERYDSMLEDIFDLQEEVTRQVVGSVAPQIDSNEIRRVNRGEQRFDEAHDLSWRSFAKFREGLGTANMPAIDEGIALARRALDINPNCSVAYRTLCSIYAMQNLYAWGDDPVGAADRALAVAEAAKVAMPQSDVAYYCLGVARSRKGQFDQAVRDLRRAHELNPNDAAVLHFLAWCEASLGDADAARQHADLALRLSPKDENAGVGYLSLAMVAFVSRDHETFVDYALQAIQAHPKAPIRRTMMVAYAAEIGDRDLLNTHLAVLNSFTPDFIPSLFRGENRLFAKDEHMELLLSGLRRAGLEP